MVSALFDSNILIDLMRGHDQARIEFDSYDERAISVVTWIEVLVGVEPDKETPTRDFLSHFRLLQLTDVISERAILIRRERRIKLPDAIIWASAQTGGLLLVTRNEKDFPADDPGVRVPYRM